MKTITSKFISIVAAVLILAFGVFALAPPGNPPAGEKTVKAKTVKSDPAGKILKVTVETPVEAAAETDIIKSAAREPVIFRAAADTKLDLQHRVRDKKPDIAANRQAMKGSEQTNTAFAGFGADNNARAKI